MADDIGCSPEPADLAQWSLHCYCPHARQTPHALVRTGDLGRLLYAARAGASVPELRSRGIEVSEPELAQLVEFDLVAVVGDQVRTTFPVLGAETMTAMRASLRQRGAQLAERITPAVADLRAELAGRGQAGSGYAMVFGHALDGLLWTRLRAVGAVPETTLTPQRPWWNGAFWAIYPGRAASAGTNFLDCGAGTLVSVWTDDTVRDLTALATAPGVREEVAGLLAGMTESGAVGSGQAGSGVVTDGQGRQWRLRSPDGRPAIPVVGGGGPLDSIAGRIAATVADALAGDELAVARELVGAEPSVSTVVVAHELIWEITESLLAAGALAGPPAQQGERTPETLIDLLYVTTGEF
ncbi:hypothetical protein JQS43_02355 [Natronosporangium hydrolyticum]|uniref:Uncharacterized protein n=1 Tax=Natronosporangium hydrolyticum TaxID=2811111 RepID=A0A895YI70_9ACTN|nr:hypothetical protein [Natronosporangium hydrolyticum]QSB15229.1 hypothetical protein JQS43_02355 [Natronosporangium hydrolyticum]